MRWAEPNLEEAVDALRRCVADAPWRRGIAERGRARALQHLSPAAVAARMRSILWGRPDAMPPGVW
jgi:hypothetical protein